MFNQGAWQPFLSTSTESYCGNGGEGGCDTFHYGPTCNFSTTWGLMLDGDGAWAAAAFKFGDASSTIGCGQTDRAYLNNTECIDEIGEMYYR